MCGICGFSKANSTVDKAKFEEMVDMIAYRGPDARGSFYEGSLALGHRRLAILDLSEAGAQPFVYKDYVLTYNGEIYNFLELKQQLSQKGYTFETSCDTEVLAAAYHCYGEECVQHLNGMWAFCIYDRSKNMLFCSRDRFGIKPFYYTFEKGDFAFASEIKQLLLWQENQRFACMPALERFLVLGEMDEGENTLFEGVAQLLPGHNLRFDLKSRTLKTECYFTLSDKEEFKDSYEDGCEEYKKLFKNAVERRLFADVQVGSCLSGGIDSSAIVGAVHELLKEEGKEALQHTVSSCYEEKAYNEQKYIDMVLEKTNAVSHKIFPNISKDTQWLDKLIWHMDEPLPSSSPYSQWCVFEEAKRQDLTVMLDGQGADEQMAGYSQFYLVYFTELLRNRNHKLFKKELEAYKTTRAGMQPVSTFSVVLFCYAAAFLPKKISRLLNSVYISLQKPKIFSQKRWKKLMLDSAQYTVPSTSEYIRQNISGHLCQLLHLEDRNSMAHSIEARVPFMDVDLAMLSRRLPFAYKIKDGVSKSALRDAVKDILPHEIYARHGKMGFPAPEMDFIRANEGWFRAELKNACRVFPSVLNEQAVMQGFERHLAAPQKGEFVWWRIMCVSRWAKLFSVKEGAV